MAFETVTLPKIAFVASVGGHLTELLAICEPLLVHEHFWVINDRSPVLPPGERAYQIVHAERDFRVLFNFAECLKIFSVEEPGLVISTGAGPAVPAFCVARALGIPTIYVEPSSAVRQLTLTGRILQYVATEFYVQWPELTARAGRAKYVGGLQ